MLLVVVPLFGSVAQEIDVQGGYGSKHEGLVIAVMSLRAWPPGGGGGGSCASGTRRWAGGVGPQRHLKFSYRGDATGLCHGRPGACCVKSVMTAEHGMESQGGKELHSNREDLEP